MICNASPIIFLSKIEKLQILKELFGKIYIPSSVKEEVIVEGKSEVFALRKAMEEGWISVVNPSDKKDFGIGKGEQDAISLAIEQNKNLIMGDAKGVKIVRTFGVDVLRTTSVILMCVKKRIFTKEKGIETINRILKEGYYISPFYYSQLIDKLR